MSYRNISISYNTPILAADAIHAMVKAEVECFEEALQEKLLVESTKGVNDFETTVVEEIEDFENEITARIRSRVGSLPSHLVGSKSQLIEEVAAIAV